MAVAYGGSSVGGDTTGTSNRTITLTTQIGNLYLLFIELAVNTNTSATCSDDNAGGGGGTWTQIGTALNNASSCILVGFVRDSLPTSSASTVITVASGSNTSGEIITTRWTGMSRAGALAVRQYGKHENVSVALPDPIFPAASLTSNPTITVVGGSNSGTSTTLIPPTNWTSRNQAGQITPTSNLAVATRDSGFAGTSAAWLDNKDWSQLSSLIVELDASSMLAATVSGTGTVSAPELVNSQMRSVIAGMGAVNGDLRYSGLYRLTQGEAQAYHVYHGARIFG